MKGFYSKLVRLEGKMKRCNAARTQESFYSKLVRLEVLCDVRHGLISSSFYSKLVRLEVRHLRHRRVLIFVSIPNWFD